MFQCKPINKVLHEHRKVLTESHMHLDKKKKKKVLSMCFFFFLCVNTKKLDFNCDSFLVFL